MLSQYLIDMRTPLEGHFTTFTYANTTTIFLVNQGKRYATLCYTVNFRPPFVPQGPDHYWLDLFTPSHDDLKLIS